MRHKNVNFKFKKKSLKSYKIPDDKNIKDFDEYYSKIFLNCFESSKQKEESKNNIDGNFKFKKNNKKPQLSSNNSNRILKISLYEENKLHKKNIIDIVNNNEHATKERKTANINKKFLVKKIVQSISEKNIKRDNKNIYKNNANLNTELNNQKKKNDLNNNNIKFNLNNNNSNKQTQKPKNAVNNIFLSNNNNNNKERKNKSLDKRKERKSKNFGEKKNINLRINTNEMANNKKYNYHFIHNNKSNKININKSLNKRSIKNNINKSPEINLVNNNLKEKNLNKSKKIINTDVDSNSKINNNNKKIKKTNDNYSSKNIFDKNTKINSLKKHIIEKKGTKNIFLNSSNSKVNNTTKQNTTFRRIKVESIKIDLNVKNPAKNNSFISQEKTTTADNHILNDKNNLTVRDSEITKFNNKNLELNLAGQEMSELNRSVKTSFSVYKTRSLSKKREEKKRSKMNNLEGSNNTEENNRKLNNILISLSNIRINTEKKFVKKSEPKKLIDKIRKFKKLQNIN